MQEVRDLTTSMKEAMDFIRKSSTEARANFASEVERARVNVSKVHSMAQQLKSANVEMEAFLGNTDTNFPPAEPNKEEYKTYAGHEELKLKPKTDMNGVTLNTEATK